MHEFSVSLVIKADVEVVWQALADIGSIDRWNSGVVSSTLTSSNNGRVSLGSSRYCELGKGRYLNERVTDFEPSHLITFSVSKTNLPFTSADIRFHLSEEVKGFTQVIVSPYYQLKFGIFGRLLNFVLVQRAYSSGMHSLLKGLKHYCEVG